MYLKSLTLTHADGTPVRRIRFHAGLNLIVDETPSENSRETGNNVGKTTVLKLVDFCLNADAKPIYTDPENTRNVYRWVRDYLVSRGVQIALALSADLADEASQEVLIERNFLSRSKKTQRVDGIQMTDDDFEEALTSLLFPGHYGKKPTFRQIIAHNIRYTDLSVNNTLKNLNQFTRLDEYETLYLFLLGCEFEDGNAKQELRSKIALEESFKKRLETEQTRSAYEAAISLLESEIRDLEQRKASLNLNPDLDSDLVKLNQTKYEINRVSSEIGRLELKRDLILEAKRELASTRSAIDVRELKQLYEQATTLVEGIQKTFEELHEFHNRMVEAKIQFITQELPELDTRLSTQREHLRDLVTKEAELGAAITRSDSFDALEELIRQLNSRYERKGQYESVLGQLRSVDASLRDLHEELTAIENELFSEEFELRIQRQVNRFNEYFAAVSDELYGEQYALKFDPRTISGRRLYEFKAFNMNFSTGKKQGEVCCFDLAYTMFADAEGIPCMHFLLNDKKELMHSNQLLKVAELANSRGIQLVVPILKDKLPPALNRDEYVILKLSQDDKLFRIEKFQGDP